MNTDLALELAQALPALWELCPRCFEGHQALCTIPGCLIDRANCPSCHGTGYTAPDLHIEGIRAAMLAAGYEHEAVTFAMPDDTQSGPYGHVFARPEVPYSKRASWSWGADDLETCCRAALDALAREAR